MHAEIEPIAGVLRVYEDGCKRPDPYIYHATIRWVTHERVELMTVTSAPTMEHMVAAAVALKQAGVRSAYWQRYRNGIPRIVEMNIEALAKRQLKEDKWR